MLQFIADVELQSLPEPIRRCVVDKGRRVAGGWETDTHALHGCVTPSRPVAMFHSLRAALWAWLKSGCRVTDQARYLRRKAKCLTCPHWNGKGWFSTGQCRLCGCATELKLRMATAECPDTPPRWRARHRVEG